MNPPADSADLAPAERLHPLIILTGLGGSLRGVAGGYAGVGYLAATGRLEVALLVGAALLVGLVISLALYWRRFSYRVGAHEIRIDSGIVSRTHRSIPFDRVQDVELEQGPLARLLGLAKVKFETGGASAGGEEEGVLPAIALHRAQALRDHVRARRGSAPLPAQQGAGADEQPPIFAMDVRRVLVAGVFNFSLAIFAGLFGATQTLGDVIGFDPFEREFWEQQLSGNPLLDYAAEHRLAAVVAGLLLLALAGLATGLIRTALRNYGFRLDRSGIGLRRRRGLLTRTDVTLPLRRAQAALILTGPVRGALGWFELKLQSLAQDEGGRGDHTVAPLATAAESKAILAELGWTPAPPSAEWRSVSRAYVWSLAVGLAPVILLASAMLGLLAILPYRVDPAAREQIAVTSGPAAISLAVLLSALVWAIAARWLAWRRTAYTFHADALHVRTGWWRRRHVLLPLRNVQSVDLSESFISRRFGTASLTIGVAGGRGFAQHSIPAIPREKASQVRDALLSRYL
ncbi:MAG TPA: PH domain-containing protein [Sphingomicrobium sp.]|jgi:putative membrane protein|nr:PH domain-containing protein [Sphingomicrobium sp.]